MPQVLDVGIGQRARHAGHVAGVVGAGALLEGLELGEFKGQNEIPRVAGQNYQYIVAQLKAFKERTRTNDAGNMTSVARTLSDADIENLAHYISGLR